MKIASTKPYFFEEDIEYILDKFREILEGKSFLSQFKYCEEFERKFAEYVGTEYAVTTTNGTAALELMLRALNIKDSDIIVPTNTITSAFDIHEILIEDVNTQDKTYELVLYYGDSDTSSHGRV